MAQIVNMNKKQLATFSSSNVENEFPEILEGTSARYSTRTRKILGRGASSIVYSGYHSGTDTLIAVKWIEEKYLRLYDGNLPMEWKILQDCENVNIIKLFTSKRVKDNGLYLALDMAEETLHETINRNIATREHILTWLNQICEAIKFLHSRGIIHRDIKPSNILLVRTSDNVLVAKLSDFGLSKKMSGNNLSGTLTSAKGTFPYMSPETLKNITQQYKATKGDDMFSLGMTLYFALSNGKHPFNANGDLAMKARILDSEDRPDKLPDKYFAAEDLLGNMLDKEPTNRPTIIAVLSHSIFWTMEKKKYFLIDIARSLESSETGVSDVTDKIDKTYNAHFKEIYGQKQKFDWLKLLEKSSNRNLLLSSKSRPNIEKNYKKYNCISRFVTLFRDKHYHSADLKTDQNDNNIFTENGKFSEEKFIHFFLELCPSFVDVVYSVVRENPLLYTAKYYNGNDGSTSSLCTTASQNKSHAGSAVTQTGTATLLKGSKVSIYENDPISENYFRGYSDSFLNPAAVYKISLAHREHFETSAEKWKLLASTRPGISYFVPILSIAKRNDIFYVATKFARRTLSSELQLANANSTNYRSKIIEYFANVANGIAYLHENMVVHGKIDQDHIMLFGDKIKVAKLCLFALDQPNDNEGLLQEMKRDLMSFADLVQISFSSPSNMQTNGSNTSAYVAAKDYTWNNLVRWIRESSNTPPTISQVASHPLFWDMRKSFNFISMFWRTLTVNGKLTLDEQYAKLYRAREKVEFDWIFQIDHQLFIPSLAKSGNNLSGLLCLISLAYNGTTIFKGESAYMEYFNAKFPDILIICFCAALSKGYIPECYQNDLRQFVCHGQTKKEEVHLSEWLGIPLVFENV